MDGGIQRIVISVPLIGLPVDALADTVVAVVPPAGAAVPLAGAAVPLVLPAGFGVSVALLPPPQAASTLPSATALLTARKRRRVNIARVPNPFSIFNSRSDIALPFYTLKIPKIPPLLRVPVRSGVARFLLRPGLPRPSVRGKTGPSCALPHPFVHHVARGANAPAT